MMIISTKRQSLSNMLRRIFAFLILGGLVAVCSCEPVNRKFLPENAGIIGCADDVDNASACGSAGAIDTSASILPEPREKQTPSGRKLEWTFLDGDDAATKGEGFRSDACF
jgi:hypothetical protein